MGKRSREKQERKMQEVSQEPTPERKTGMERIYFSIIEWGTYLALFTPFIFFRDYYFPFVVPKTVFFRIIVDVILIAYVLLVINNRRYLPKFNILTVALTVFLAITVLTSITGINLERSFWSTFERMTGLLTFFHLYAFFIILTSVFKERKYWEKILTVSIFVGILICFYLWTSESGTTRGGATLGNTSFLSAYLLFDIFFAMIFFLSKGGWRKILYGILLVPLLLALFNNIEPTRGAIGAFFISLFFFAVAFMWFSKKRIIKKLAPVILILGIFLGAIFTQTAFFSEKVINIKEVPGRAREIIWEMGYYGWQEKFWLGWGQENFNVPFAKYYNPELPLTQDVWYDRVHNIVLDTAVTSGLIGLLSYLSLFAISIFKLLDISGKVLERRNVFIPLGMITLLIAYFIQNIWVFDMISSYMMFFLTLAFISFLISPQKETEKDYPAEKKFSSLPFLGALLVIISLLTIYFGNIQVARSSKSVVKGLATQSLAQAVPAFQEALKVSPMSSFEIPEQLSKKVLGFTFDESQDQTVLKDSFELAAKELEKSIEKNPQDYRLHLVAGRHYNDFFQATQDTDKIDLAEQHLNEAIALSPKNQQTYWSLAQTKVSRGEMGETLRVLQEAVGLEPRYGNSHWYLAMGYQIAGDIELAIEEIKKAEEFGYNWKISLKDLDKVIGIYREVQNDKELVPLYQIAMGLAPDEPQYPANLAVSYANLGEFNLARESAKKALAMNPSFAEELKSFIDQLPQ